MTPTTLHNEFVKRLISDLYKEDIHFSLDGDFGNVIFTKDGEDYKMCNWFFFHEGGMTKILTSKNKKEAYWVDVTELMFYDLIKKIVFNHFKINN